MNQRLKRTIVALAAVAAVAFAIPATEASATAQRCQRFGNSYHCVTVTGTGRYVSLVIGQPQLPSGTMICNYQVSADLTNTYGQVYQSVRGPMHYGCTTSPPADRISIERTMPYGTSMVCSGLYVGGVRQVMACVPLPI